VTHLTGMGGDGVAYDGYGWVWMMGLRMLRTGGDGFGSDRDGRGWVSVSVPVQTSNVD